MRTAGGLSTAAVASTATLHVTRTVVAWVPPGSVSGDVRHSHSTTVGTAVEVTDDARPQRPSPNDEPYDTCTETARDRESGTTMVPERDGDARRWHVRR